MRPNFTPAWAATASPIDSRTFGNILQNGSFNAIYTANNQMYGFPYDAAGNMLSNGVAPITWDAENRMVTNNGATYIYDAMGNRVEKQGSGVTDTIYFGGKPIARYSAGQWTDLIYGPTGLLAEVPGTQSGAPVYRVTDHLGTTVGNLLADGTFVDPLDYSPFGQVSAGNTSDPYLYTGLERDQESGLDHAQFRQYASSTGRWMSPDPYDGSMNIIDPQTLNRYAYVGNKPLGYVDPTGLFGEEIFTLKLFAGLTEVDADSGFDPVLDGVLIGAALIAAIEELGHDLGLWGTHPEFHASLQQRPDAQQNGRRCISATCGKPDPNPSDTSPGGPHVPLPPTVAPNSGSPHIVKCIGGGGCYDSGPVKPPPPCSSVKNTANALKAVGWGAGLYKAVGMSIVASGGSDLPEAGSVAIGGLFAASIGGLMGLAADYHIGCTP